MLIKMCAEQSLVYFQVETSYILAFRFDIQCGVLVADCSARRYQVENILLNIFVLFPLQ